MTASERRHALSTVSDSASDPASDPVSGRARPATEKTVSPGSWSDSRLVASTRSRGRAGSNSVSGFPQPSSTCSQSSSRRSWSRPVLSGPSDVVSEAAATEGGVAPGGSPSAASTCRRISSGSVQVPSRTTDTSRRFLRSS
ncbi:hypothetical protein GCM10009578_073500 [Streptomyces rhizosphaericus]